MTLLYLGLSLLAAIAFYLACAHQRLWVSATDHRHRLRWSGWVFALLSTATAIALMGLCAGVFSTLTATMLALVLLPYLDAWRQLRKEQAHAG